MSLSARDLGPLGHRTWMRIARGQAAALVTLLDDLPAEAWDRVTDCDPWTVKDVAAHLLGWAEAVVNPVEYARQLRTAARTKDAHAGNPLNAQNAFQVEARRHLDAAEVLRRLRRALPRLNAFRAVAGVPARLVPYRDRFAGRRVTLGYALDVIITRDHFMHRIDIARAAGRDVPAAPEDRTMVADVVREWAERSGADARVELAGPAGGSFVCGSGSAATVAGDAYEFARAVAGRAPVTLAVDGDEAAARRWLAVLCTF